MLTSIRLIIVIYLRFVTLSLGINLIHWGKQYFVKIFPNLWTELEKFTEISRAIVQCCNALGDSDVISSFLSMPDVQVTVL